LKSPTAVGIIEIGMKELVNQEYKDFLKEIVSNIEGIRCTNNINLGFNNPIIEIRSQKIF